MTTQTQRYRVVAPMVTLRVTGAPDRQPQPAHVEQGQLLPTNVQPAQLSHLLSLGMVEEVSVAADPEHEPGRSTSRSPEHEPEPDSEPEYEPVDPPAGPDPGEPDREPVDPPTPGAEVDQAQDGAPARDAPHATWVEYAVHLGYDRAAAEREDRAALVELLTGTGTGQPAW